MPLKLKDIQSPVADEMVEFEKKFRQSMKSRVMLLDKITGYIVRRKGKQMRPLFVFLSAGATGEIKEATYRGAALIELLHTATLVHDDVVDNSDQRRGFFSINALWKNKIAVLVGDFLLARGMLMSIENNDIDLLKITTEPVKEMSEGELLQMAKSKTLDITEEIYYEVIRQKTASLIKSCCKVGACSVGAENNTIEKMGEFGLAVGIAFQIKDDLFDYGTFGIGKPRGIDIREKKLTLPLIYSLSKAPESEKKRIKKLVKGSEKKPKRVQEVIEFVKKSGGIKYAISAMEDYHNRAKKILRTLPESTYRNSLEQLVRFTIERTK
ncbi:MAG: polyprenyl synthetase family protein [Ekhidna sp.]|nr:polyprenyl synthetase family protein [Ekhidna sp.]MBC6408987.1 polyprenyl synthetase family protein [Ekhidna sp.]MBC6425692.1 polyprenyl synthetase family protein [Ekhidna sp.]